jgi:hypothetical protein
LSTSFFDLSFKKFPATPSNNNSVKWTQPDLDFSIFAKDQKHHATFQNITPLPLFHKLADEAETYFSDNNNTVENPKRRSFYFYSYFRAFLRAAAENDEINNLNEHQAINKITTKPVNTHFLARVITYFYILKQPMISIPEILEAYKTTIYPQAQKILQEKFKIKFQSFKKLKDDLFFNPKPSKDNNKAKEKLSYAETLQQETTTTHSHNPF